MYKKTILNNGLRVIIAPMEGTKTATVLVMVGTGSKYEDKKISGISHFLEHLFFKGTEKRPTTLAISEDLEKIGAEYNAFTGKEYTGFYAKAAAFHLDKAMDVISDILLRAIFLKEEMEREKGVILEEIKMIKDDPPRYVSDLFEVLLYGDTPAGRDIAGTPESVSGINREQIIEYFQNQYVAKNITIVVAGAVEGEEALRKVENYFNKFDGRSSKVKEQTKEFQKNPEILIYPKKTEQTHISLGARGYALGHPDHYALRLLAAILGGGMSSRLWTSVRERQGLAYYVFSSAESYTDSGYFTTQAGIDAKNLEKVIEIILGEYKKIAEQGTSGDELQKVKDYIKGRMIMNLESSSSMASFFADQEILEGKILTPEEKMAKIDEVTIKDIQKVAADIFKNNKLNLALIGPFKEKDKKSLEKIFKL
ncbi:MAG: pitrilysin family protein [bacterium]|nr:pitrilysin family protein [bacterium]